MRRNRPRFGPTICPLDRHPCRRPATDERPPLLDRRPSSPRCASTSSCRVRTWTPRADRHQLAPRLAPRAATVGAASPTQKTPRQSPAAEYPRVQRSRRGGSGVVDVRVPDEAAEVAAAKQYLGYLRGPRPRPGWADQRALRTLVPAERRRAFKIRPILETLADPGSILELRGEFVLAAVPALARIGGHPVAWSPTARSTPAARSTPTPPTSSRASSSSATRSASRSSPCATLRSS